MTQTTLQTISKEIKHLTDTSQILSQVRIVKNNNSLTPEYKSQYLRLLYSKLK